ncbi:hypothetical protein RQP46_004981 [Phenoliferia psychrophenolica]
MAASTSAWSWSDEHRLYYNLQTQTWAAPQPDGSWTYSPSDSPTAARSVDTDALAASDEIEEGEDVDGIAIPPEQVWPGDDEDEDPSVQAPLLRLLLRSSKILKAPGTVALVDPADGVSLGRDKTFEKRVRLPELLVSKSHAQLFWMPPGVDDGAMRDGGWAAVDNGSTHGTWVNSLGGEKAGRLSPPKVASGPRALQHLDTLLIGSTTFTVHIHASLACEACSVASDGSNVIPLSSEASTPAAAAPTEAYSTRTKAEKEQDRRAQMKGLKAKYLTPGAGGGSHESRKKAAMLVSSTSATGSQIQPPSKVDEPHQPAFVDRAAARRARTGATAKPALASPFFAVPGRTASSFSAATTTAAPTPQAPPENPFATTSRGAQLLSKLTRPSGGDSPDAAGAGLGTLIQPRTFDTATTGREMKPGLGSKPLVVIGQPKSPGDQGGKRGWREDAREANRKRFKELGTGT